MSAHSTYEGLRQFADSYGLALMALVFASLAAWPFRPGAGERNRTAATSIFQGEDDDVR